MARLVGSMELVEWYVVFIVKSFSRKIDGFSKVSVYGKAFYVSSRRYGYDPKI